jgi:hypothetical protein
MLKKNKKFNFGYFIILVVVILFITLFYVLTSKFSKCLALDCVSFTGKETYQLNEVFENQKGSFLAEYNSKDSVLRVEVVDQDINEANKLIKSRIARIQGQYEEAISPYPGEISDSISCPLELKPEFKSYEENNISVTSFLVKLNERMVTGQCDSNLTKYNSYNYYFHCLGSGKTFFIEEIYNKSFQEVQPLSFVCN